ncbi:MULTISPECIES: OpgC domain-containing protein [Ensifer]|uniref:Uncharacterized protein n=1 Tax=Ensifer canadensis TaxID=555315 RepID=A0AAW4FXF8_9HYPH|nr:MULTISPECIES: OpgC domain-containing protein [Ensifer]KQW60493.1 hypothetical protein ASD02_25170 [Ensifer sp. Root1252]KRC79323.1 hypothetical protein ASE32_25710 [Ensifer sp. Root231]KRC99715.1 hypothetical protein ASE47_26070 [Ensifer sp. Root258]MBM3095968.1 hypothetical protein [Ensifer canadensis]UBI79137.1 OpgC domain-containing protein [Ensifer canadensis]
MQPVFFALAAIPTNLAVYLGHVDPPLGELYHQLVSKTNSGPLRILNVLAILYLAWNLRIVPFQMVCAAGRHSLPVFSIGTLPVCIAKALMQAKTNIALPIQGITFVVGCLVRLAVASWLERRRQQPLRTPRLQKMRTMAGL